MKWYGFQKDFRKSAIKQGKRFDCVCVPIRWLLASTAKLLLEHGSLNLHIVVTEKPKPGIPRNKARVMIPGVDYELYIEGYRHNSPLGNTIGVCEQFPPGMWP
jgi:hypothetical protein